MLTRRDACRAIDRRMRKQLGPIDVHGQKSTVIFAPHPDDETLGCGGIACKLIAAGTRVHFVFVTDGATSHANHIGAQQLRELRQAEAIEAVRRLGGAPEDVTFLRFPDSGAHERIPDIAAAIAPLLADWRPDSIFVTHASEPTSDHTAVNAAVRTAVRSIGRPVTVYEYPIWYWYHWPWVRMTGDLPRLWRLTAKQTWRTAAGLRTFSALNSQIYVGDVLDIKRSALDAHATQVRRPRGHPSWPILEDLSGGDFIGRLLTDYEVFRRCEFDGQRYN
jgi:LmbE family N-acetylglucosaminyl deacetylase